jgi:hypothetical protein
VLCPFAEHRLISGNHRSDGVVRPVRGWVLHVIVGSLSAADGAFHNPSWGASAHFGVGKDGHIVQWVDTGDRAWAEGAWGQVHGPYPYVVTDSTTGRGLGTHSMGGAAWGGHECPGSIRAAQRPLILATAQGNQPAPPQEEDMAHSWETVIYPGQQRWINIPPPEDGFFAGRGMAGSVGVDTMTKGRAPAYVVAGRPGGYYAPAVEGAECTINNGRSLQWRFKKGDQGVSVINRAEPIDPARPEKGPNLSFLFECA